jgi:hypothetical protein
MATTKEFNISSNAVTVLNQTADAAENTAKGFTSAKAELRALQQQLLSMDQSSEEFKKASARAAELKDNISDLSAEISANAGNAFEGLSNNVGLFGSRLMDLDLKGAGQALAGMGAAVNKIDFKTLKEEIGGLIQGLGKLAKAVLANPYLMLAAAIALIVANFDTIIKQFPAIEKGLTGINEQERELLELQTKRAEQAKKNYDNISAMEETLKRQGKTEKEIRDMKITAIEAAIKEAKVRLETQRGQEKAQIETAQRNREILEGVIRWINAPLYLLLSTVDKIASWVGQTTNLAEGLTNLAADLLIDPEQQQADLQKSFQEQEDNIVAMQNSLDGFRNQQDKADKDARDKRAEERKKEQDEFEKSQEEISAIFAKWDEERLEEEKKNNEKRYEERQKELARREQQFQELQRLQSTAQENEINDAILAAEKLQELAVGNAELETAIQEDLKIKIAAINKKYSDAEIEAAKKTADEKLAAEQAAFNARIGLVSSGLQALGALNEAFTKKGQKESKRQFQIQKSLNLASAVVDTYGGINRALNDKTMPSTTARIIQASIVGAMGLANVLKISKTEYGNASAPSGTNMSTGGGGGGGTTAPSPANFAFLQNQPNQQQPPLQAYVVSGQVSSNLEAQQLIQNQSRLGG